MYHRWDHDGALSQSNDDPDLSLANNEVLEMGRLPSLSPFMTWSHSPFWLLCHYSFMPSL
jgi:hypothetical protein